ncbi:MAG: HAMP domain-containing protein [Acidobacteriia bacterium]|nr:HAMP domain-containing protein [Terriglobia bacterium]
MKLRTRLLILVAITVALTVALVTWIVVASTRRSFEELDTQRTSALLAQLRTEFNRRGEEIVRRVEGIAGSESLLRIAIELSRPNADYAPWVNEASAFAEAHGLDFLELIAHDGTIVSSAQWPARFGYKESWILQEVDWQKEGPFLRSEELATGMALALVAIRTVPAGNQYLYITGGMRLDQKFLASLVLPEGMRVLLYQNFGDSFSPQNVIDATGKPVPGAELKPLVTQVILAGREASQTIDWADGPEALHGIPLMGRENKLLGVLMVGSSKRELARLTARIRWAGALLGGLGILIGVILSYPVAARFTRPIERLAEGARAVAGGNWNTRVDVVSTGEVGQLEGAFNSMTRQLIDQRDRLLQAERVAAWRELARRLAHELKNPLFPLQITVENLRRARKQAPEQYDEVFEESTATLLAELENLKAIIGRFSGFAKMPQPQIEPVQLNEILSHGLKLVEAQLHMPGRPPIATELQLNPDVGVVQADPELLNRAFQNLFLNAVDAMPEGGRLTVRSWRQDGVHIEVSDTGAGLTREECERLFTPYYTTKQHGTGLGLAIVQSVVSDHTGKIGVESSPGQGTTFHIELPG